MSSQRTLERLDDALLGLRRLWASAPARFQTESGAHVELSTVLVADAVQRLGAGASVAEVADRLSVAPSTASRLIDRAVDARMVERAASSDDARRTSLRVTGDGSTLLAHAVEFRTGYLAALCADWTAQELTNFSHALQRFSCAIRDNPIPSPGVIR